VRQLTGAPHIEVFVSIDIGDRNVFSGGCVFAAGECRQHPLIGVLTSERDSNVADERAVILRVGLMNRDNVEVAILVEVRHLESVATTNRNSTLVNFIADENIDSIIVEVLRANDHEVRYIAELDRGADDEQILQAANNSGELLITADKDFGEIVSEACDSWRAIDPIVRNLTSNEG
jgi:hypothetical protein